MNKLSTIILVALATFASCSGPGNKVFTELDRAIGLQEEFDRRHTEIKDSLRHSITRPRILPDGRQLTGWSRLWSTITSTHAITTFCRCLNHAATMHARKA